jgi:Predicted transcriptional regulators
MDEFAVNQSDIARRVGKSRAAVSNTLRLLELDEDMRRAVQSGLITEGHARALISIPDSDGRKRIFQRILADKLSVRDVEKLSQGFHQEEEKPERKARGSSRKSPEVIALQSSLEKHLGTKVEIIPGSGEENGKIVISYFSLNDFERVAGLLKR